MKSIFLIFLTIAVHAAANLFDCRGIAMLAFLASPAWAPPAVSTPKYGGKGSITEGIVSLVGRFRGHK